ncbi:DUF2235 domain-containing protein [Jannaschia sp. LMIT008]|uniref:DUF2235 domain-containing protein n=1 Tax=Jannaschia maritima TaxID=3032585 RepID=UPI0028117528|nr:DUF2235 domain-containing protein [Jannaschia sp. LMIT008]
MKRIVILCDGTWNRSDSATPTNVVRFAQAMRPVDPVGVAQVPVYVQGVGTGRGPTRWLRGADAVLGGAFGLGLMDVLVEAYRHLVFLHEPGDEIFVLGFSRGAYTARSLVGLIRSTGIVDRDALHRIPEAVARYRTLDDPDTHPGSEASHAFRARISTRVTTSEAERLWRGTEGHPDAAVLRIRYLGVWDSVGALGVPASVPVLGHWTARKHRFHDAALSSMVESARHAVALDETRRAFAPTRWDNVAALNEAAAAAGADPADPPYRELFFAGDHGSVGGGGDVLDLSSIGLLWVIEGAQAAGLGFDARALQAIRAAQNPHGPLRNRSRPAAGWGERLTRMRPRPRRGPDAVSQLHSSVLVRYAAEAKGRGFRPYRPASLARLEAALAEAARRDGRGGAHLVTTPAPPRDDPRPAS